MPTPDWFFISNEHTLDSPSLLIYAERVRRNIDAIIRTVDGNTQRLMPHIKTHKMPAIVTMMLEAGITRFKCATIAEAEMLAMTGAKYIVIAHQLVPPKTARLLALKKKYPDVFIASLLDNRLTAQQHSDFFYANAAICDVFLDVNNGMNRSGVPMDDSVITLYNHIASLPHIRLHGLHIYDGHLRSANFSTRKDEIHSGFLDVEALSRNIAAQNGTLPIIIAGGTPAFSTHAAHSERLCSPGTCVLWDWGYDSILPEQRYEYAALVLTRIISKPLQGFISIDMGHKAVAAENPINKRIRFLNLQEYELVSQSEEHSVLRIANEEIWEQLCVGEVLYGVPYHICPTVNLYDEAYWIESGIATGVKEILARKRRITV